MNDFVALPGAEFKCGDKSPGEQEFEVWPPVSCGKVKFIDVRFPSHSNASLSFSCAQLRIHRKLKEVAVFRYSKKVNKEDGSVRIIFYDQS